MKTRALILQQVLMMNGGFSALDLYTRLGEEVSQEEASSALNLMEQRGHLITRQLLVKKTLPSVTIFQMTTNGVIAARDFLEAMEAWEAADNCVFGEAP